jgi:hypothetical protein
MWRLYTLHNVRRTLSYITLSKYVHYLICTLLMYKILQTSSAHNHIRSPSSKTITERVNIVQ